MNGSCLLDTSVVVPYLRNQSNLLAEHFKRGCVFYVNSTVLGELYAGAYNAGLPEKLLSGIDDLVQSVTVLSVDEPTCHAYGKIYANLKNQGTLIPQNDMWVAATAIRYQVPLAHTDKHFALISDLETFPWM